MLLDGLMHLNFVNHQKKPVASALSFMKRILLTFLLFSAAYYYSEAQTSIKTKKYPSLLWEITGNGIKKPSYLIGTMHVSSKIAFNLPDSFYFALRSAQVVALETNPETWQEDMNKYDLDGGKAYTIDPFRFSRYSSMPDDYLTINTLKFYKYYNKIERSLYSNPSTINSLLYRTYGNESSDFEEDTYLDMYIFQCGKKWGKKVTGVEDYGKSMQLMAEAYKDAAKDKSRKERSYTDMAGEYSTDKLQEAYRTGDLDLLDSINKYNSVSAAFDEKFLYQRNEIQARSIDSIITSGSVLFVGVGAAHLPGDRGVIEILRRMGYKLRPVKMGARASREKELVDKIRVPVSFKTETAKDGMYKVDIPGTLFKLNDDEGLDQWQYADMANGSYYMVTRIMTNAWMWNHTADDVYKKVDSLLYENVPGKIISKTIIFKNGYKGFDITNRTRRGDLQRYNIFITPYEIILFKMSGNGDYVKLGDESNLFFGSIALKEFKNGNGSTISWKKYSPTYGGFSVDMPHEPYIGNDGSWIFDAGDKTTGNQYRIIKSSIHNYNFAEEDSFDLGLMDESFKASEFIDSQTYRQFLNWKGYPALDGKYNDKNGSVFLTRFIIQGPHYYTLIAHGKKENADMGRFLNSFEIKPFVYGEAKLQTDTSLYYSVITPVFPDDKKIKLDIPQYSFYGIDNNEDEESEDDLLESGAYRNKIINNDSTGEKIYVSFYRSSRYYYTSDSAALDDNNNEYFGGDSSWIVKFRKKSELSDKTKVWESVVTDTGSSRTLRVKAYYKNGIGFSLITQSDTLSVPSPFVKKFYETFSPSDTLKGINPFEKKSPLFFSDFMGSDSTLHKRAVKHIDDIKLDSSDFPQLKKSISWLNWGEKKYLNTKQSLINKLGDINTKESALHLKNLYFALEDTIQLQYAVLENLLQHKTAFSYNIFRDIINNEPPVLDPGINNFSDYSAYRLLSLYKSGFSFDDGRFLDELSDSLKLTKTILPDLLPLLNLEDYKSSIMKLLGKMVEDGIVKPNEYEQYYTKFLLEAKQELKKQSIAEKKRSIEKAEEEKLDKKVSSYYSADDEKDKGNADLSLYATLLLPFWDTKPAVQPLLQLMLNSGDKRLKYTTMLLLMDSNKPYPDSLLTFFAGLEEYRYELYSDLKKKKLLDKFPAAYNNHLDLGKSALMDKVTYNKPDTIAYIDRLKTKFKDKEGYIYFYKYKVKKDDITWNIATVGLVPTDPMKFEFEDSTAKRFSDYRSVLFTSIRRQGKYDFTSFGTTKIKNDELLNKQLSEELKKMLYSRRKSGEKFYGKDNIEDY